MHIVWTTRGEWMHLKCAKPEEVIGPYSHTPPADERCRPCRKPAEVPS